MHAHAYTMCVLAPNISFSNAYIIGKLNGPSNSSRNVILKSPMFSCLYAIDIDKNLREDTLNALLGSPNYCYAALDRLSIPPSVLTRTAVSPDPEYFYWYVCNIDKCPRVDHSFANNKNAETLLKHFFG